MFVGTLDSYDATGRKGQGQVPKGEQVMTLTVDVISDVICPWCYIGKRRLEKAFAARRGQRDVRVRWHPFQLNPHMPKEGMNRKEYRTAKFGSGERSLASTFRWRRRAGPRASRPPTIQSSGRPTLSTPIA